MEKTKDGISLIQIFFIVSMISNAIVLYGIEGIFSESEITQANIQSFRSITCFSHFVSLLGFIILITAVYKIYKDSSEISLSHEESVNIAIVIYIFGIIGGIIYTPINTFLFAIGTVYLVKEIAPTLEKRLLYSAAGVQFLTGIGFVMMFSILLERDVSIKLLSYQVYWIFASATIGHLLFIITYRRIGKEIDEKILKSYQDNRSEKSKTELTNRCPRCGEDSFKVQTYSFNLCSECGFAKGSMEVEDEKAEE